MRRDRLSRVGVGSDTRSLRHVPGAWAVCQWDADDHGAWAALTALTPPLSLLSLTRTSDEVSAIVPVGRVPAGARIEAPFSVFVVEGTLEFTLVGVLHGLTAPLVEAGIPVVALSTFKTDYLLVAADLAAAASSAWRRAGYVVVDADMAPG